MTRETTAPPSARQKLRRFVRHSVLSPSARFRYLLKGTPDMVFVWIPKTAGSSLYFWLNAELGMLKMKHPAKFNAFPGFGAVTFSHCHYLSLREAGVVPTPFHDRAFRFSVVRNPYLRAVSLYHYLGDHNVQYEGSFVEFLQDVRRNRPPVGLYNVLGLSQTNPQMDWLQDADGGLVVDHVYRIEALDQLERDIAARFGPLKSTIPSRNTSKKATDPRDILTEHDEIVPLIQDIYHRDFEVLGFDRDLPAPVEKPAKKTGAG